MVTIRPLFLSSFFASYAPAAEATGCRPQTIDHSGEPWGRLMFSSGLSQADKKKQENNHVGLNSISKKSSPERSSLSRKPITLSKMHASMQYEYLMKRAGFGKQPLFCEAGPEMADTIPPNPKEQKLYILRNPVHSQIQNTPVFSKTEANTVRAVIATSGMNHSEGGWPKDVNYLDPESTQRYRRKIEKDENYIGCILTTVPESEHYIYQNNAVNMYQTYNTEIPPISAPEKIHCRSINIYRDEAATTKLKRGVKSISWQTDGGKRFVATYVNVDTYRNPKGPITAYVWHVERPLTPQLALNPICTLMDLQFSPRNKNDVAGALINGQVAWWDIRVSGDPVAHCAAHVAHRDMVSSVLYINSKSGTDFFSGGVDGCCKWWDVRNLSEPLDEIILDLVKISTDTPTMARANGVSVLEYEATIPTRFMVGTENGMIICGNRKGKSPFEQLPAKYDAHLGPIWSLERNPNFLKNFLSVGDWTARIWSDECRESAILWTPPSRYKITSGTWSPSRISLMLLTQSNGILGFWDLLRKQHEPVLTIKICDEPLTKVVCHENGHLAAVGTKNGNISMIELSPSMTQSSKNDKNLMTQIFEREIKRERILEARLREIRLKLRQAEEIAPVPSSTELDPTIGDKDLLEATAEFNAIIKKELAAL